MAASSPLLIVAFDFAPEQRTPTLWGNRIRDLEPSQDAAATYGVECDAKSSVMKAVMR